MYKPYNAQRLTDAQALTRLASYDVEHRFEPMSRASYVARIPGLSMEKARQLLRHADGIFTEPTNKVWRKDGWFVVWWVRPDSTPGTIQPYTPTPGEPTHKTAIHLVVAHALAQTLAAADLAKQYSQATQDAHAAIQAALDLDPESKSLATAKDCLDYGYLNESILTLRAALAVTE